MSRMSAPRDDRLNGVLLRSIGALTLTGHRLQTLTGAPRHGNAPWYEFADHLIESVSSVLEGAAASSVAGATIPVSRQGARVVADAEWIDRLTDKITRHIRVGLALGIGEASEELALV